MFFLSFYTLGLAVLALAGALIWKRVSSWGVWQRAAGALLPVSLWNMSFLFFLKMKDAYFYDPNWERLQNVFALAAGDSVYHGLNEGAILNSMYGPVSILAFLPAVFAHTPASVMAIASFLVLLYFFSPIFYLHLSGFIYKNSPLENVESQKQKQAVSLFCIIFFSAIVHLSSSLRNAGFRVHADAPALGLGALACVMIVLRRKESWIGLCTAALAAVLSVWTKQVMVPLIAAAALYLWITEGRKVLRSYLLWILFWGGLVSAVFLLIFKPEPLFINMFYIPGQQSLREGWFLDSLLKLFRECLLPLTVLAAFLPIFLRMPWKNPAEVIRRNRWSLFLLSALFLVPTSILGNGKLGGSNNTLSYTGYFLLSALTFAVSDSRTFRPKSWISVVLILTLLLGIQIPSVYYRYRKLTKFKDYPLTAFNYIKNNPGKGFFPRLNVLSIMNEEKVYHTSCGVIDRSWARLPINNGHLRAHLPAKMDFMAFREGFNDDKEFFTLPEFWYISSDPELPDFRVYRRNQT